MIVTGALAGIAFYLFSTTLQSGKINFWKLIGGVFLTLLISASIYMDFQVAKIEHRQAYEAQQRQLAK